MITFNKEKKLAQRKSNVLIMFPTQFFDAKVFKMINKELNFVVWTQLSYFAQKLPRIKCTNDL